MTKSNHCRLSLYCVLTSMVSALATSAALEKTKEERAILERIRTLAQTDADRTSIAALTSILRLRKKERIQYFEKIQQQKK